MQDETDIKTAIDQVKQFFAAGTVQDKLAAADMILAENQALYFDGAVSWSIELPDFDRVLRGQSENLENGIADIRSALKFLAEDYGAESHVAFTLAFADQKTGAQE